MKTKKVKPLTVRQQIQQCPTLTPEERSLALFGLLKARRVPSYRTIAKNDGKPVRYLVSLFVFTKVPVIKGQTDMEAHRFWMNINNKLGQWEQQR